MDRVEVMAEAALTDRQVQLIAKALADPRRWEILERLGKAQETGCTDILSCLKVTPPTLSHHMKELETAELVEGRKEGKFMHYSLRRDVLQAYMERLGRL